MLTSQYAKSYPQMRVNAVDPGYTATDLNAYRGTQTVEQGAEIIVRMASIKPDGPTRTFTDVKRQLDGQRCFTRPASVSSRPGLQQRLQ
jgi:NAD(P)-dependent dehydrogenase (short-subunit alcohol dehydrogenase family)